MTYPEFYRSSLSRSSIIVLFFFLSYVRADDLSFGPSLATLLGVCVCLVGGIVDNLGVTLQKISHGQRNENQTQNHSILDGHSSRGYWRNKTWLLGIFFSISILMIQGFPCILVEILLMQLGLD